MVFIRNNYSLRTKLFMSFFLLSTLITLAISYKMFVHMRTDHLNTLKRDLAVITGLALSQKQGKYLGDKINSHDKSQIYRDSEEMRQQLSSDNLVIDKIYIWRLVDSTKYEQLTHNEFYLPVSTLSYLRTPPLDIEQPIVYEVPNGSFELMVYAPLYDTHDNKVAVVGFFINGSKVRNDMRHFTIQVANTAMITLVVVGVISWWLARGFSQRLTTLHDAIDELASGNMDIVLPVNGHDEVARIANRLNQLAKILSSKREEALLSAIESLVAALEAKDSYTYGHSSQVSSISHAISIRLGLSEQEQFNVRIAALLHDIGKIGIPDRILYKPGKLDEDERKILEQHPEIGARIIAEIPALAEVTDIVKHHHSRWDGQGYPADLRGNDIPIGARIIAVADTFQAMTSDRPYRQGVNADIAITELRRCSGSQFDPEIVEVFLKAL